jgi:hypothetical protein
MAFTCKYCSKPLSTKYTLAKHIEMCETKKYQDQLKELEQTHQSEIAILKEEMLQERRNFEFEINTLKTQLQCAQEFNEQLLELTKRPTHTTINNQRTLNIVNQLAPYDLTAERAKAIVEAKFDEKVVKKGENGLLDFVVDHLLTDESSGKPKILCTDLARKIGKYLGPDGQTLVKDVGLTHTIDVITPSLCSATHSVLNKWGDRQQSRHCPTGTANGTPPMTPRDYSFYYESGMNNIILMGNKGRFSSQLAGRLVGPEPTDDFQK